ncbi:MAG: hypothetical protein K6B52_02275 [Clostridiales bacterium]|nr:hypothetical protein [Clostridiales bacterium]
MAKNRKKKKNKLAVPAGIITVLFAIGGLVAGIMFCIDKVKTIIDKPAEKAQYEQFLKPVVMFDPDPFDDLARADKSQLLYAAVWALLMSDKGIDGYSYSEGENIGIVVPQGDIDNYFVSLFGNEIDLNAFRTSIDMSGYGISYNSATKSYILPITGIESAYTPKVYEIEKIGDSVVLSVGYIGNKTFADISQGEYTAPSPDKMMAITLRERNGKRYVSSIQPAGKKDYADITINEGMLK